MYTHKTPLVISSIKSGEVHLTAFFNTHVSACFEGLDVPTPNFIVMFIWEDVPSGVMGL